MNMAARPIKIFPNPSGMGRGEISIQRQRMFTSGDLRGAPSHNVDKS
jgi:hypothetical protein